MQVIKGMPMDLYQSDPAPDMFPECKASLSSHVAHTLIAKSPLHARHGHPRLNQKYEAEDNTKFSVGSAAHRLFLERSDAGVDVLDYQDWRTNDAKTQRDISFAQKRLPILKKNWGDVQAMVTAAREYMESSDELCWVMEDGEAEQSMFWKEDGVFFRTRPDWAAHNDELVTLLDYKTTGASADPASWAKGMMVYMGYDMQAALYRRGMRKHTGQECQFLFLVQEDSAPYACSAVGLSPADWALADDKLDTAIAIWKQCLAADNWPGYPSRVCWNESPSYVETQWAERKDFIYETLFSNFKKVLA